MNFIWFQRVLLQSLICSIFLFFQVGLGAQKNSYKQQIVSRILKQLYAVSSYPEIQKPEIQIIKGQSIAAQFVPASNTIFIEDKLYLICRNLGSDSLHALAYIIGHELTHAIYKDLHLGLVPNTFLKYASDFVPNEREEQIADLQGSFLATLAGYKPQRVLAVLIDKIYQDYSIEDKEGDAYPPKSDRVASAEKVLTQLEHLLVVFEASNLLVAKGDYLLAQQLYNYILQYYRAPEIYNNLGIALTLQAMQYFNAETDVFVHPLELDLNSRLKKFNKSRGDLPKEDLQKRMQLLNRAKVNFETALNLNDNYIPAKVHLISCFNLMNQPEKAIQLFNTYDKNAKSIKKKEFEYFKLRQAVGISHALQNSNIAFRYFNSKFPIQHSSLVQNSNFNSEILQAQLLKALNQKMSQYPYTCSIAEKPDLLNSLLVLEELPSVNRILLNTNSDHIELAFKSYQSNRVYTFSNVDGPILSIVRKPADEATLQTFKKRVKELDPACQNHQSSNTGMFYSFESSQVLYQTDIHGKLLEQFQFLYN